MRNGFARFFRKGRKYESKARYQKKKKMIIKSVVLFVQMSMQGKTVIF